MRFLMLFFTLLFMVSGCAGVQQYSIGIPSSAASKFFFHMEKAAIDQGMEVTHHAASTTSSGRTTSPSLAINLPDGWLRYSDSQGEIMLAITVKDAKEMSEEEIAAHQEKLKAVSDTLVDDARERSKAANDFE